MVNAKRLSYIGAAAAVLAAAAVGLWLLFAQGGPAARVSAAQALSAACDTLAETDYDRVEVTTIDEGKATRTRAFSVSGDSARVEGTLRYNDGSVPTIKVEDIRKDGVWYRRGSNPDNPSEWTPWGIFAGGYPSLALPCFDAGDSAVRDLARAEGDPGERRIVWWTASHGGTTRQHILWLDSKGRPVKGRIVESSSNSAAVDAAAASAQGDTLGVKVIMEETYSGFGEPNVVTAPFTASVVSISGGPAVTEGEDAVFTITVSPPPSAALAVKVLIREFTGEAFATNESSRTVTIPTSGSATLTIATVDDDVDGAYDGEVTVDVEEDRDDQTGHKYVISDSQGWAWVTVYDNDEPKPEISITAGRGVTEGGRASFILTASPKPSAALSVSVAVTASGDYGVTTGTQTVSIPTTGRASLTVATAGDSVDEADGSITATVKAGTGYTVSDTAGAATVAVKDDDDPPASLPVVSISAGRDITEGGWAAFTLTTKPRAALDVTVTVSQSGEHGVKTGSRTVSIPARGSAKMEVSTQDDGVDEANGSVTVTVKDGTGYTVSASKGAASVTVKDNDEPSDLPQLTIADASASESAGAIVFVVTLNKASEDTVTVEYQVAGGTATRRVDYEGKSGVLSFAPGETRKEIKAAVYDDSNVEGDETAEARLLWYPAPKGAIFADMLAEGVIVDDD